MNVPEELVAVYDPAAATPTVVGSAPRSRMRAENLPHASTAVLLRRPSDGAVYVHRRTPTKDLYPGFWDCWAGGVVAAGEDPLLASSRELAEELGVVAPLRPLGEPFWFHDDRVSTLVFAFEAFWDGPVVHQPSEVAEGGWWPVGRLEAALDDPATPFMPDGRAAYRRFVPRA